MNHKKNIFFSIILFIGIGHEVNAQGLNITGDTIFVNAEAEIQVSFPTLPKSFSTIPNNAPYNVKSVGTGVVIIAKFENSRPAALLVSEGGRNHHFTIVFKKNIDYSNDAELVYDYSTEKKLEQHIRATASRKTVQPEKTALNAGEIDNGKINKKETPVTEPVDNSSNYYALLEQGDKDLKQKKYENAKLSFEAAHNLRPDDGIPIQRLEEIKTKIAESEKSSQQDNDSKYLTLTDEAKTYLDQKKYTQARETYKQALDLRPGGDLYVTHQLETIDKLLQDQSAQIEQQNSQNLYNNSIAQGEKALNKTQFADARVAYEQALIIRPNDPLATSRLKLIDEKEKAQKENEELENNYNAAIQAANTLFQAGDLQGAKIEYTKATGFIKNPLPLEQIKIIDKKLADQVATENKEKQALEQQAIAEQQKKEDQELENNYADAIRSADKFFNAADYDNAKIEYNKALDFIKKDWPRDQIVVINKIIADRIAQENTARREKDEQELEHRYDASLEAANKFFLAADYANAKIMYNRAMSLIPRPEPKEKIKEINKILADQFVQKNEEMKRQAHEAEITSKYTAIIKNADIEYNKPNYTKARKLYTDASNLKPADDYAKQRLLNIENIQATIAAELKAKNDSIAHGKEINRKYSVALSQGKSSFLKNDLSNAKIFYEEAASLKPSEEAPKKQLTIINNELADIAKENELDNNYESKKDLADSQLIAKEYDAALITYNEALRLKPGESYPKKQIKYIQSELAENEKTSEKLTEINKKDEEERKYTDAITRAEKATTDKRYDDAKSAYIEALGIHPDNENAKRRLEIISFQLEKANSDKLNQASVTAKTNKNESSAAPDNVIPAKDRDQPSGHLALQTTPIPYSSAELKKKYPGIDFSALPPEQPFNKLAVSSKENLNIYDTLLLEKPRLDISSTDQEIKLNIEGINFEETTAYVKVLIQNNSKSDFLTGAMMLTWTRKTGNHIKLYPNHLYPSPLPIIKPGSETVVIYVCKTYDILDGETLTFELIDRFKKVKLEANIPGSAYNREWVRYQ